MPDPDPSRSSEAPAREPCRQPAGAPETESVPTRCSAPAGGDALPPPTDLPARLGRYRVTARLGKGGFGVVYRGYDEDLRRDVAIKVPHRHRVRSTADAEAYLAEARVLAGLDHPGIVPVYDLGRTDDGLCYVVSKFVEGGDLTDRLRQGKPTPAEAAEIVRRAAEALHHAHQRHLIHRDIKPANILIDGQGQPVVADFGLALREEDFGTGPGFAGTPAYMSPEQARGEGHRVDARTDVYSLGVVLYVLLTGQRPFQAESMEAILEQVKTLEPRPPRQVTATVPRELDRICLKCLSKRAADRYSTARDLADDLGHWQAAEKGAPAVPVVQVQVGGPGSAVPASAAAPTSTEDRPPARVVPKGLRSFDAGDADFFLDLLPGPRDRDGLPESIRFWKTRIEEMDADRTFAVGLLYGPSGCGKSSLVKAGLLPRLAAQVAAVYVEATAEDTEARLLKGLRKQCPEVRAGGGLAEVLAELRRGRGLPAGRKVLLVLDQFEQWLHARRQEENTDLVGALRQCDGGRVQALVLVRDDFWMAATRFMGRLETPLLEGQNSAAVDLFDPRHARKVLTAFGRAFGALPEGDGELPAEQARFVEQAVEGLAQDGKVISVRLALFAEMVKGRPWTPATYRAVGGTTGVGVTFLEETFSAATAPPLHRYHQRAARALLKALLPEEGSDIKGHVRSGEELRQACGHGQRPADFAQLLAVLDGELRLVTPTDPEGVAASGPLAGSSESTSEAACGYEAGRKYYQLTHDYLVPSLREWLTRKQRETRRGRAELRLAERAAAWQAKRENRHLPAWWEWLNIRLFTRKRNWTEPQRRMMRRAGRYHGTRAVCLAVLLAAGTAFGLVVRERVVESNRQTQAAGLVDRLLAAEVAGVPEAVRALDGQRRWADPLLREALAASAADPARRLRASLGLLPVDDTQADYLFERLLDAAPAEVPILIQALLPYREGRQESLWQVAVRPEKDREARRLRAASALAAYDPDSPHWKEAGPRAAELLLRANPLHLGTWEEALRPARAALLPALEESFRGQRLAERRQVAATILADYAADNPDVLAGLAADADAEQLAVLLPALRGERDRVVPLLEKEVAPLAAAWRDSPLDAAWHPADAVLVREVENAAGLVAERFALCQKLPLERAREVVAGLKPAGYRPERFRPFRAGGKDWVAVVWVRDGKPFRLDLGLTAAAVRARDAELQGQKPPLVPHDVAGYRSDAGLPQYAGLWVQAEAGEQRKVLVGVPDREFYAAQEPLKKEKFIPLTVQALSQGDERPLYCSVWRKGSGVWSDSWRNEERRFRFASLDKLPLDVDVGESADWHAQARGAAAAWLGTPPWLGLALAVRPRPGPEKARWYAGVWGAPGGFEAERLLGLDPEAHLVRCRALAEAGWRPAGLSVAEVRGLDGPGTVAASLWHRPAVAEKDRVARVPRQAGTAGALLRLDRPEPVWPLLRHTPAPDVRSHLIARMGPLGVPARTVAGRLFAETDDSARRALIPRLPGLSRLALPRQAGQGERVALPPAAARAAKAARSGPHAAGGGAAARGGLDRPRPARRYGETAAAAVRRAPLPRDGGRPAAPCPAARSTTNRGSCGPPSASTLGRPSGTSRSACARRGLRGGHPSASPESGSIATPGVSRSAKSPTAAPCRPAPRGPGQRIRWPGRSGRPQGSKPPPGHSFREPVSMSMPFDATLKDLGRDYPADFLSSFDRPPAGPFALLNVDLSTVTTSADLVVGLGDPLEKIVHIDFQSSAAAWKHADVLVYNALLYAEYHVPVHSIVVLLRPQAAHANLNGAVRYSARPESGSMNFTYQLVRLWEWPAEDLLAGALGTTPLAMLGALPEGVEVVEGLAAVAQRLIERLEREASHEQKRKLLTSAFVLTGLRVQRDVARQVFRGVRAMRDSDTYLAILDEGREDQVKKDILRLGRQRFGLPDEAITARLSGITELDRLERVIDRLLTAAGWQDLLDTP